MTKNTHIDTFVEDEVEWRSIVFEDSGVEIFVDKKGDSLFVDIKGKKHQIIKLDGIIEQAKELYTQQGRDEERLARRICIKGNYFSHRNALCECYKDRKGKDV